MKKFFILILIMTINLSSFSQKNLKLSNLENKLKSVTFELKLLKAEKEYQDRKRREMVIKFLGFKFIR